MSFSMTDFCPFHSSVILATLILISKSMKNLPVDFSLLRLGWNSVHVSVVIDVSVVCFGTMIYYLDIKLYFNYKIVTGAVKCPND